MPARCEVSYYLRNRLLEVGTREGIAGCNTIDEAFEHLELQDFFQVNVPLRSRMQDFQAAQQAVEQVETKAGKSKSII